MILKKEQPILNTIFVIINLLILSFLLHGSPLDVHGEENNQFQTVSLNNKQDQEVQAITGENVSLLYKFSKKETVSFTIPKGITFSSEQLKKENPSLEEITIDGDEMNVHTTERKITVTCKQGTLQLNIAPLIPGTHTLLFNSSKTNKQIQLQVAKESVLSQGLATDKIASLPLLTDNIFQPFANPAPPTLAANVELMDYFSFNGSASIDTVHTNVAVPVTPRSLYQASTMWSKEQIDLTKDFSTELFSYIYESGTLADGITITFHNDSRGATAIGSKGKAIAVYGGTGSAEGFDWVKNALSIEFDPYHNPSDYDKYVAKNHIAFLQPGNSTTMIAQGAHNRFGAPITGVALNANRWRLVTIDWNATTKQFALTYNDIDATGNKTTTIGTIHSSPIDIQAVFGGSKVYWGFTTATGASTGTYYMAMKKMPNVAVGEINKKVRNNTKGETTFAETTTANPEDNIEYELSFKNDNRYNLPSFTLKDQLQGTLQQLIPASTTFKKYNSIGNEIASGSIPDSNWTNQQLSYPFGTINKNEKIVVYFKVKLGTSSTPVTTIKNDFQFDSGIGISNSSTQTTVTLNSIYTITEKYMDTEGNKIQNDTFKQIKAHNEYKQAFPAFSGYTPHHYTIDTGSDVDANSSTTVTINPVIKEATITYYYDKLATINLRQVVLSAHDELVLPKNGHFTLKNSNGTANKQMNMIVNSGKENDTVAFTSTQFAKNKGHHQLIIDSIIPEHYKFSGYVATITNQSHFSKDKKNTGINLDYTTENTYWVTVYIEPALKNNNSSDFYSWHYEKNELGNINTK